MIQKIKKWLQERFLPMWAKETVLADNRCLQKKVADLQNELDRKDAYIAGLVAVMKSQRRIVINTTEERKRNEQIQQYAEK